MQKSTAITRMKTKDFFGLLEKDDKVNWAHQTKLLKKLMGKFSDGEIIYAMNHWKKKRLAHKVFWFSNNKKLPKHEGTSFIIPYGTEYKL